MATPPEYIVTLAVYSLFIAMPGLPLLWLWSLWTLWKRQEWDDRHTFAAVCLIVAPMVELCLLWYVFGP